MIDHPREISWMPIAERALADLPSHGWACARSPSATAQAIRGSGS
jgi:hypothetical protein